MAFRVDSLTVNDLQKEFDKVKEGLKGVDENIKKLTGRDPSDFRNLGNRRVFLKRDFAQRNSDGPGPIKRRSFGSVLSRPAGTMERRLTIEKPELKLDSEGEEEEEKTKPSVQSSVVAQPTPSRLKQDSIINTDARTKSRNQRMFGMLLGTLQRFKQESSDLSEKEKRRTEIVRKIEIAEEKEKQEMAIQRKGLFTERRAKQMKLKLLEQQIEVVELQKGWDEHDARLSKYIKTKAKPSIFYLPRKHTPKTTRLLEASTKEIKDHITERKAELEKELESVMDEQAESNGEGRLTEGGGDAGERMETEEVNHEENQGSEQWVEREVDKMDVSEEVEDGEVRERKHRDSEKERRRKKSRSVEEDL